MNPKSTREKIQQAIKDKNFSEVKKLVLLTLKNKTFHKVIDDANDVSSKNRPPLLMAALKGNKEIVEFLLEQGADGKILGEEKNTLMHYAVASGNKELVEFLIQKKIKVEGRNRYNFRPLHWAATKKDLKMVELLVEKGGAKMNIKGNSSFIIRETQTPLFIAIKNGNNAIAKYLVKNGVDVNDLNNSSNETAIIEACRNDNVKMIKFLLENGASPNGVNKNKEDNKPDYFLFPLAEAKSANAVKLLVEYGADINATNSNFMFPTSALREMVGRIEKKDVKLKKGKKQLEAIKTLIDYGASLSDGGYGMIESAAKCKEVVTLLLNARKTPKSQTSESQSKTAMQQYKKDILSFAELLLGKRITEKTEDSSNVIGRSLLEKAKNSTTKGDLEVFMVLLEHATKEDVNLTIEEGRTALHKILRLAYYSKYKKKDEPNLKDYTEAIKLLLKKGANPNAIEYLNKNSPLHEAAKIGISGYTKKKDLSEIKKILKLLVRFGAKADIRNDEDRTPTDILSLLGQEELIKCLN